MLLPPDGCIWARSSLPAAVVNVAVVVILPPGLEVVAGLSGWGHLGLGAREGRERPGCFPFPTCITCCYFGCLGGDLRDGWWDRLAFFAHLAT